MECDVIIVGENKNQATALDLIVRDIGFETYVLDDLPEFERLISELRPSLILVDETQYKGLLNNFKAECKHILLGESCSALEGHIQFKKPVAPQKLQAKLEELLR